MNLRLSKILAFTCGSLLAASVAVAASASDSALALSNPNPAWPDNNSPTGYRASGSGSDFNLPQIGEAGANIISPEQEYEIGVQVINELRDAGYIMDDPLVDEYIQNLGHQISSHSDNPSLHFSYLPINDNYANQPNIGDVNAETLPGGFIVVNSGLIMMTDNEDELAGVLAHETGHVTQRHLARQAEEQRDRSFLNFATMLGAVLAAAKSGDPDVAMGALATAQGSIIQHEINYTRGDESEADRVGVQTLARAGFQPQGMVDFFKQMQRDSSLNGYDRIPQFLLDHPLDLTRMADMQSRAEQLHVPPRPDSRSYALMKARLRVLESDNASRPLQFFQAGVESAKGWDLVAMRYGLALSEAKAGRYPEAVAQMQALVSQYDDVTAFRIGLADALIQSGQIAAAVATYRDAMRVFPDSTPLVLSYANDLVDVGKPQEAIDLLMQPVKQGEQTDPETLRLLAKAYDKAGNSGDSHYYMSEYYFTSGQPIAAVDQLRIALATPGIDSVQRQRYRARLDVAEAVAKEARRTNNNGPGQQGP